LLVDMECMVLIRLCFGMTLVDFVCEQGRTSTVFAQASHSRLSENHRISSWVFIHECHLGDQFWCWVTR